MGKNSTPVVFEHVIDSKIVPRRVSAEHSQPFGCPEPEHQVSQQNDSRFISRSADLSGYRTAIERDIGRLLRAAAISLNQNLDQWLTTAAKPRLRPKSYTDYQALLPLHIRPALGTRPIGAIAKFDIQSVCSQMLVRYGGKNVSFVGVLVVISFFVSAAGSKASCCFQADAFQQVVESLGDRQIEFVQLRDLLPGEAGVGGEGFPQASRQGWVDFFRELQVDDAEPIAFG